MVNHRLSLSCIVGTIVILMLLSFMPHHHHGLQICIRIERCDLDGMINDVHTEHHPAESHHDDEAHCVFNLPQFLITEHHFNFRPQWIWQIWQDTEWHLIQKFPPVFEFQKTIISSADEAQFYQSALLTSSLAFRAPPVA